MDDVVHEFQQFIAAPLVGGICNPDFEAYEDF